MTDIGIAGAEQWNETPTPNLDIHMQNIVNKIKRYGLNGAVRFAYNHIFGNDARIKRALTANARRYPMTPSRGVTVLLGHWGGSLQIVMTDIIRALNDCNIPNQVIDISKGMPAGDFKVWKYSHVFEMYKTPFPDLPQITKCRIAYWEFDSGLELGYPHLFDDKPVIGMSDFNASYYRKVLPKSTPVFKLLYPLRKPAFSPFDRNSTRRKYGIPAEAFAVFYNFGLGSARKNPEGAIKAFAAAFQNKRDVVLVFKTSYSDLFPEHLEQLAKLSSALGIADRFITINERIPVEDIYALTDACDTYLSLHRGEGFGLGIAEAMSLGKPVVITNWSAPTEFCNTDNSILIPFNLCCVKLNPSDHPVYDGVTRWAEADTDAAANALSRLYNDRIYAQALGQNAATFIREYFSIENFKKSINDLLDGMALQLP